ncbi:hypothetical protein SEVIR_4G297900v4 [Setaria viridis]|uniref:Exocyst subunit Exo70 family protein n=1 Tax=Setaria viridis TaxID=4556 RepID=A0A4U6V344_SETVI|nr:hypothetical protein SEVIR_4G297900v2 [Setaria viridis]
MAAAGWWRTWRSRVSSSTEKEEGGGAGDPVQVRQTYFHPNQMSSTTSGRVSGNPLLSLAHAAAAPPVVEVEDAEVCQERLTDEDKVKTREHIRDLIHRFRGAAMDKWLSEVRVSFVLHLAELEASKRRKFISSSRRLRCTAHSWALALHMINRSIVSFTGWCCPQEEEAAAGWPSASELVRFVAATFMQLLPFVDIVVALDISNPSSDDDDHPGHGGAVTSAHKFQTLIQVRDALSEASELVQLWDSWLCSSSDAAEATRISGEMSRLVFAKLDKLEEAIRDTRDCIRTQSTMSLKHDYSTSGLDPSPDIHKVTRSVISYIIVLSSASYDRLVDLPIVLEACLHGDDVEAPVPDDENATSSIHLIMLMMRSLEEKLTRVSQSFPDQSLRFLFLLNNSYFVWHQLRTNQLLDAPMQALARRIDGYISRYLQASWTPVLKPLHSHTLCCFMRCSSLHKFESNFEKTYAAQKLWKVPDPELRRELRRPSSTKSFLP